MPFLALADHGIAALPARFVRVALLDAEKTQEEAKEESFRKRNPEAHNQKAQRKQAPVPKSWFFLLLFGFD